MEILRRYRPGDLAAVADVYRDAVCGVAPAFYDKEQVSAWAVYSESSDELAELMSQGTGWVIETGEGVEAFALLQPPDYVSLLYCRARASRRGYASRLLAVMEAEARRLGATRVRTAASLVSHRLFLRHGYTVDRAERVEREGVFFDRHRMSKDLTDTARDGQAGRAR